MEPLCYFDANASFGRRALCLPGSFTEKETLLKHMEEYGIARALVFHSMAKEYDPLEGNSILMREIASDSRLVPLWAALPSATGEFPSPGQLLTQMRSANVRAVTLFPAVHGYSLSDITCGSLFEMLEANRVPLFLGLDQVGGMEPLGRLVAAHPGMRIVVTNVNFRVDRDLYPLLDRYDNLWVETSGYKPFGGIAAICRRFGASRLVFGTGMPQLSCAASIGLLSYADISDEEKHAIAGKNLERLLSEACTID